MGKNKKLTVEEFLNNLQIRFPKNHIEIIEYDGTAKSMKYRCLDCGRIYSKAKANHLYENIKLYVRVVKVVIKV